MWTATAVFLTALAAVVSAQDSPECSDLGFGGQARRFPGRRLPVCTRDVEQCCSEDYVEGVQEKVRERLETFLRKEFEEVIEEYQDELDNLIEYFTRHFPRKLLQNLPFSDIFAEDPTVRSILETLTDNLEIVDEDDDDFDAADFLEKLHENLVQIAAQLLGQSEDTTECIVRVLRSQINRDEVRELVAQLRTIRRGLTALMRIGRFLERQRNGLQKPRILEKCVSRFIQLSFCSRCTRHTPPLCYGTCNALVRGCYAPYYTVLNRQYNRLWEAVIRIVERLNSTVENVSTEETHLIDIDTAVSEIRQECGIRARRQVRLRRQEEENTPTKMTGSRSDTNKTMTGSGREESRSKSKSQSKSTSTSGTSVGTTRDSTGDSSSAVVLDTIDDSVEFIPFGLVEDVFQLNGAFQYGRRGRGLRLCYDALQDERKDNESCPTPEMVPEQRRFCRGSDICTSRCHCTDGMKDTMDNETEIYDDMNDVDDQDDNPVLEISEDELNEVANAITADGDPVAAFLASDEFTSVDPGVEERGGDDLGEGEGGSAAGLGLSLTALLLTAMAAFIM